MPTPQTEEALRGFAERDEDALEGALIVATILAPDADVDWARSEIDRLAGVVDGGRPADVVATLAAEGFAGAGKRYYEIENSVLDHVLRERRGIPISLGVVHIGVAQALGLDAQGINFPRHFLVTVGDLLVDPYAVAPTSAAACRAWLRENRVPEAGAFDVATPRDIAMRMLNNVRMLLQRRGDFARALEVSDCQLVISTPAGLYGLHVERADAWVGLNAPEMVVAELGEALRHAPNEAIAERLRERIEQAGRLRSEVQ